MKKFYIIFFIGFVVLSTLLYLSIWWFVGGAAIIAAATIYHFYNAKLKASDASIEELESQVEELQAQLDRSLLKEEKASREAVQIRHAKQELLTVISHEIRTPMNGVLGMSLLLADTVLTKEQKEYNDTIRNSGQGLLKTVNDILVNDILDYSKLEKKGKKLEAIDFDLRDTVEEVLNLFANKAGKNGIDLLYQIEQNVPLQLQGDNKRLREVLMNLIENAVKFTEEGEVLVTISSLEKDNSDIKLRFEIKDSGAGIAEDRLSQLFYGQTGKEFSRDNERATVGLVMSRKQVELMGGTIDVASKLGEGSTFIFELPFVSGKTILTDEKKDAIANLADKKALIVDDNLSSANLLEAQLKKWNINCTTADSGMKALELLESNSFDFVLTDSDMPQLNGLQLTKLIKNKYSKLPVIILNTASNEIQKQDELLFAAMVPKPVRLHVLMNSLLTIFNKPILNNQQEETKMENNFAAKFPLKILIAEDNLINQKIAMKILTKLGYNPSIANNGGEAFESCTKEQWDIILMDVQMPVMDGLEATRKIRSDLNFQPIIMAMTANVLQGDRDACLQAGMNDYISKPINLDELIGRLEKWSTVIKESKAK